IRFRSTIHSYSSQMDATWNPVLPLLSLPDGSVLPPGGSCILRYRRLHRSLPIRASHTAAHERGNKCQSTLPYFLSSESESLPGEDFFPLFRLKRHSFSRMTPTQDSEYGNDTQYFR